MSWVITGSQKNKGLLDEFTGSAAAYSLRDLTFLRGGPVVRVRRSSDNTEQDFTATQVTDGSLTTFCGAGNGFVRTWYDQSGAGNHAQQATTSLQPTIVSVGALVTESSKPALSFSSNVLIRNGNTGTFPAFVSSIVKSTGSGFAGYLGSATNEIALGHQQGGGFAPVNSFWAWAPGQASTYGLLNSFNANRNLHTYWFPSATETDWRWYFNGSEQGAAGLTAGTPTAAKFSHIGSARSGLEFWSGTIQEIIIYESNQTTNRNGIEANINAHYAIY
jgi:hypothetical protein